MKDFNKEFNEIIDNNFGENSTKANSPQEDEILIEVIRFLNGDDNDGYKHIKYTRVIDGEEVELFHDFYVNDESNIDNYIANKYKIGTEEASEIRKSLEKEMYPELQN
jgi:hypothetical protein